MQNSDDLTTQEASTDGAPSEAARAALENFKALLADADFTLELELLGIKRMQFMRRRQMQSELMGLYMALWRLALARSFPVDAPCMFELFSRNTCRRTRTSTAAILCSGPMNTGPCLSPRGDGDFSEVARHLCSFSTQDPGQAKSINLKLVLHIRKIYKLVFDRLI